MKNDLIFLALALIIGALIPIQAATNTAFNKSIGSPFVTGLMVFTVGVTALILFNLVLRTSLPGQQQLASAPWYGYLGGIIMASYVVAITVLVPRIGVGTAIGFIVTGQILCAVVIDHFGLFNVAVRAISLSRVAGMVLMIIGVYLVMKK